MSQFRTRAELQAFVRQPRDEQISLLIKAAQLRISTVGIDQAFREAVAHAWDFGGLAACEHVLGNADVMAMPSVPQPEAVQ